MVYLKVIGLHISLAIIQQFCNSCI